MIDINTLSEELILEIYESAINPFNRPNFDKVKNEVAEFLRKEVSDLNLTQLMDILK